MNVVFSCCVSLRLLQSNPIPILAGVILIVQTIACHDRAVVTMTITMVMITMNADDDYDD